MNILVAVVLLGLVSVSHQFCFQYDCPHQSTLEDCVRDDYICQDDEICEVQTHAIHGSSNAPWVSMACIPNTELAACFAQQAGNDPECNPNQHEVQCHYCCEGVQCVLDLVDGIIPTADPDATPAP